MKTNSPPRPGRTFQPCQQVRFSQEKAAVTELSVTTSGSVAVWGVKPGQVVAAHFHPDGQDTWVMLRGELTYYLGDGRRCVIRAGEVDVADRDQVHGAINEGTEDAVFVSIYSAPKLGWIKAPEA